jgi:hypothetical protein
VAELILEPFSVVQRWTLPQTGLQPEAALKEYLEALARNCQAAGDCVIGHIKALALFPERGYLRVSVVAAHLPASIDGAAPPGCTELEVTLNVLVYGLERERIEQITRHTAQSLAQKWQIEIS